MVFSTTINELNIKQKKIFFFTIKNERGQLRLGLGLGLKPLIVGWIKVRVEVANSLPLTVKRVVFYYVKSITVALQKTTLLTVSSC